MAEQITLEHLRTVLVYVNQHGSITNRECRMALGVGYDSSIKIFTALCDIGILKKSGEASGTKYVVPPGGNPNTDRITVEHLTAVMDYVLKQGSVTNHECREATGVSYNSSIRIFAALRLLGMLRKVGEASATKYLLGNKPSTAPKRPGFHRKLNF